MRSVLNQTYANVELIAVDDGSTDGTVAILNEFASLDERVVVVSLSSCSGGPATPRNAGLKVANGSYFAFIDSDDVWHPQKLELQMNAMDSHNLRFLSTEHISFSGVVPKTTKLSTTDSARVTAITHSKLIRKNCVVTSSALMTRDFANTLRFDQSAPYIGIEDYLAWLTLHQQAGCASGILHSPLVLYRIRDDSISSSKLTMARKIYYLLRNYQVEGQSLGIRKHVYFLTYIYYSLINRLRR